MEGFNGTPGPWVADGLDIFSEDMDRHVCIVTSWFDEEIEDANANLIAAAPELLESLQEMVDIVKKHTYPQPDKPSSTWGRMEAAEAVIAKALGQ